MLRFNCETARQAYIDSGNSQSDISATILGGEPVPQLVVDLIRKRIRRSLEQRVKKARKQLKNSKLAFGNKETRTLILIAMDQTPIFGHQNMILNIGKILGDNYADEYTDGIVYFNPNTPTRPVEGGMAYTGWFPFYRDDQTRDEFRGFVDTLGNKWLNFFGKKMVRPIQSWRWIFLRKCGCF